MPTHHIYLSTPFTSITTEKDRCLIGPAQVKLEEEEERRRWRRRKEGGGPLSQGHWTPGTPLMEKRGGIGRVGRSAGEK